MDNLKRRVPEDPTKINLNQQWEVEYWTKKLGISASQLRAIVAKVGIYVADVKKELSRQSSHSLGR